MEGWKEPEENPPLILAPIQETETDIMARIQLLQPQDSALSEIIPLLQDINQPRTQEQTQALIGYSLRSNNIVLFNNLIYVPDNHQLKLDILNQVHNTRLSGHLGNDKTYRLLARTFYFPHMRAFINTYVQGCETCTRNKTPRHQPYGLLQPLPIPDIPWQSISMDSIVKLPLSKGFNSILVVVDRLTKMAHFIPYQERGFDAPNLANNISFDSMESPRTSYRIEDRSSTQSSGAHSLLDLESSATSQRHFILKPMDKPNV
jgi:hypothetical protein